MNAKSLWVWGVALWIAGSAQGQSVVNFDDLITLNPQGWSPLGPQYGGFTWSGWEWITQDAYQSAYANSYGSPSAPNMAYNSGGSSSITVSSELPFQFLGASFSTFAYRDLPQTWSAVGIRVTGYRGQEAVGSVERTLYPGFKSLTADFENVDRLVFESINGLGGANTYWLMDGFTFVPEPPACAWLSGLGLAGFALIRRRLIRGREQ